MENYDNENKKLVLGGFYIDPCACTYSLHDAGRLTPTQEVAHHIVHSALVLPNLCVPGLPPSL